MCQASVCFCHQPRFFGALAASGSIAGAGVGDSLRAGGSARTDGSGLTGTSGRDCTSVFSGLEPNPKNVAIDERSARGSWLLAWISSGMGASVVRTLE
jgi:hypothetical protein